MVVKRKKANKIVILGRNSATITKIAISNMFYKFSKHSFKIFLFGIFIITITLMVQVFIPLSTAMSAFNKKFTDEIIVTSDDFMTADANRLHNYAEKFEKLMELYNMPYNLTGDGWDYYIHMDTRFVQNPATWGIHNSSMFLAVADPLNTSHPLNQILKYEDTGHAAVYSGYGAIGEALRYAIAVRENNISKIEESRQHLLHLVKGYDLLSAVMPDGRMARFVAPDTPKARQLIGDWFFKEEYFGSHLFFPINYTAPNNKTYTFYAETGTSVDCYMVYLGLGMIYMMCNDTEIRSIIRKAVDRMLSFHVKTGFKFVDYDGKTHSMGAEAITGTPIVDPMYAVTYLRVGKTVNPQKWANLYNEYTHDRMFIKKVGKHSQLNIFSLFIMSGGYFNINMAATIAGVLSFLEDDPQLKKIYQDNFLKPVHNIVKYHRNAWFDALYCLGMSQPDYSSYQKLINVPSTELISLYWKQYIEQSIADCLMRMTYTKYPYRKFGHPNGIESYNENIYWVPIQGAPYPTTNVFNWNDYVNMNDPLIKIFFQLSLPQTIWDQPIPADWRDTASWIWQNNCFSMRKAGEYSILQPITASYTAPYWIAYYLNLSTFSIF
ncbi:MAG: hypothetical protein ACTSO9_09050 [Candidatus Helarchaeota archaeon]